MYFSVRQFWNEAMHSLKREHTVLAGNQGRGFRDVLTAVRRLMTLFSRELTGAVVAALKSAIHRPSRAIPKRDRIV
jgi:hypothetical protein